MKFVKYLSALASGPTSDPAAPFQISVNEGNASLRLPHTYDVFLYDNTRKTLLQHVDWAWKLWEEDQAHLRGILSLWDWRDIHQRGYRGEFSPDVYKKIKSDRDVRKVRRTVAMDMNLGERFPERHFLRDANQTRTKNQTFGPPRTPKIRHGGIVIQDDAPWGLVRSSHKTDSTADEDRYRYDNLGNGGAGTYIYVLDDGVDDEHEDLRGRVIQGPDFTARWAGDDPSPQDARHGTHVASIAAGTTYGIAKNATVVSVKVVRGPQEDHYEQGDLPVFQGIQWAVHDIMGHGRSGRAVINLSLGAALRSDRLACWPLVEAIWGAARCGIPVVVAAGNEGEDADVACPGHVDKAITVGAVNQTLHRWPYSNYGDHVNIFAPGVDIPGAEAGTKDGYILGTGTSMAAPHVSGVLVYLLKLEGPRSVDKLWKRLRLLSLKDKVNDARGPNRLLYNGAGNPIVVFG